jgi:hypothetical protein
VEAFDLVATTESTDITYSRELGADLWSLGRWCANRVAYTWERAVEGSLDSIKAEAERRSASRGSHLPSGGD